jgi:hypothetical protein
MVGTCRYLRWSVGLLPTFIPARGRIDRPPVGELLGACESLAGISPCLLLPVFLVTNEYAANHDHAGVNARDASFVVPGASRRVCLTSFALTSVPVDGTLEAESIASFTRYMQSSGATRRPKSRTPIN